MNFFEQDKYGMYAKECASVLYSFCTFAIGRYQPLYYSGCEGIALILIIILCCLQISITYYFTLVLLIIIMTLWQSLLCTYNIVQDISINYSKSTHALFYPPLKASQGMHSHPHQQCIGINYTCKHKAIIFYSHAVLNNY